MTTKRHSILAIRLLLLVAALALMAGSTVWIIRRTDRRLRANLLHHVRLVAFSINPARVAILTGTAVDVDSPDYQRLKEQLSAVCSTHPQYRFIYLMGRHADGHLFFFVDNEPVDSKDYSPPGEVYEEATDEFLGLFAGGRELVEGPVSDRWGTWVSACVSLPAAESGGVPIVLGIDVDATRWKREVAFYAALPMALVGISILLGLFVFLLQGSHRKLRARQVDLRESEARYRTFIDATSDLVFLKDESFRYLFINEAYSAFLAQPQESVIGRTDFDLMPDEMAGHCRASDQEALKQGEGVIGEESMDANTYQTIKFPVSLSGGGMGVGAYIRDITERKKAGDQLDSLLKESQEARSVLLGILEDQQLAEADSRRLSAAIEQAAEVVVVTDPQGIIQYVNPAFETITGYTREEAIGQNPRILQSGEQDEAFYHALWETLVMGETWRGQFVNKRKDGSRYTEDAVISPVFDDGGRIVNFVAVKHDITEQMQLSVQLQQSQKMDSVGRLAGGIAHDFNNMLTVILGQAQLALEQMDSSNPLHAALEEIKTAAEHSADLTRQLLAFARRQTVTPRVLDLNESIESILKLLRRLIGEDIKLDWRPAAKICLIKMDPAQIDQILANLCVNARDAIAGVGQISIETGIITFDEADCVEHTERRPGDFVRLIVSDTGRGMDADTISHIFEPFFTTKGLGEGTGLGLSTVYGVIKQNEGFIYAYSEPGKGTTFRIYLPCHIAVTKKSDQEKPPPPPPRGSETILLAEDEAAILEVTTHMLENLGYTVWPASTPEEALQKAREGKGQFQLLLTDVVMPGMNGWDLAQTLTSEYPKIHCLFMSGYTADVLAKNNVIGTELNYLQKPFLRRVLAEKVREVLDG